jgi:hypothetical protein
MKQKQKEARVRVQRRPTQLNSIPFNGEEECDKQTHTERNSLRRRNQQ